MSKILLIIQREFFTRIKKKSFIILTILMPFVFAAMIFVPVWLATIEDDEQRAVAVFDSTTRYIGKFKDDASYRYVPIIDPNNPAYYSDTTHYEAVVSITDNLMHNPKAVTIYSNKEVPKGLLSYIEATLNEEIRHDKLAATGIADIEKILDDVQSNITVSTIKRNAEGNSSSSNTSIAIAAGFISTFLIYMFVMSYGGMVMASVIEEKTNRIVELMVSSVKPFQLMIGKIIGIACVGFVQLSIWAVMLFFTLFGTGLLMGLSTQEIQTIALQSGDMSAMAPTMTMSTNMEQTEVFETFAALANLPYIEMSICFILYFIGGYLLYASFFAAVGASVNEQEDSSQFMMPVVLIMIFGLYAAMGSADNTNGPLAFWASMFPLTSPIVMMVRIPFSVPLWQEILSLIILYGTALLFVWFSARIYRVGILMYGKKPSLKEMIKWMRYK